ncbi:Carboxypeptidase regulatory-like domain protein [uncultured archaeon]|nr:Carboxypeptidase regulatory-like domain protein [uncultured archaeon]
MRLQLLLIFFLFASLFSPAEGHAILVINNLSVEKPNIWLGDTSTVYLNCIDNVSSVSSVYAYITSTTFFQNSTFQPSGGGRYFFSIITPTQFNKVGSFNITAYCTNALGENANSSTNFTVSNLSMEISSMTSPVYIGDSAEIDVAVKEGDNFLIPPQDVPSFDVSLDGVSISTSSHWEPAKGWVLNFDTKALASGTHTISITARYSSTQIAASSSINILPAVDFSVSDIDKTWISAGDEVTASLKAADHGNPLQMKTGYLSIQVDSTSVAITDLSPSATVSGGYAAKFIAPSMSAGAHTLKVFFNYGNASGSYPKNIIYVIPVSGNIFAGSEKTAPVQIRFVSGDTDKTVRTDSAGAYSILLPPSTYNVQIIDGSTILDIYGAKINSFDDAIKYQALASGIARGIQGAGIFFYGIAFDYSSARLRMPYDQSRINDESTLRAYVCPNWNSGKKECPSEWKETDSKIDTVRKTASINISSLNAAYIIGSPDSVSVEASLQKDTYNIDDKIAISGISLDGSRATVPDATIAASIEGTPIRASVQSNAQGVFSLEIQPPASEGNYSIVLDVSKSPYLPSQKRLNVAITKTRDVSIIGPDTVRLGAGESSEAQFRIVNAGQSDLSNLLVSIKGVPSNYYQILPTDAINSIKAGEEKTATIRFNIPADAAKTVLGGSFEVSKQDFVRKRGFTLTIGSAQNTSQASAPQAQAGDVKNETSGSILDSFSFGLPTGKFLASQALSADAISLAAFAVLSISTAFVLRKRRIKNSYALAARSKNRSLIFEIKSKIAEPQNLRNRRRKVSRPASRRAADYARSW